VRLIPGGLRFDYLGDVESVSNSGGQLRTDAIEDREGLED